VTALRRTSQFVGWAAVTAVGVLLVLETTEVIGSQWRDELGDAISDVMFPTWPAWASALVGVGLAIMGVLVVAAQLAPPKKGLTKMHEVHSFGDGDTRIAGRAAIRAARHELESIDGVVATDARIAGKRMYVELKIDDRADLDAIETEARDRLGHEFWIDLGLADFAVNLLVTHHGKPPRVR